MKISPQNLNDDLLNLCIDSKLKELFIVQNGHTPVNVMPCSKYAWEKFRNSKTSIRVHFVIESNINAHIKPLIQPNAPIYSIWIDSTNSSVNVTENINLTYSENNFSFFIHKK